MLELQQYLLGLISSEEHKYDFEEKNNTFILKLQFLFYIRTQNKTKHAS